MSSFRLSAEAQIDYFDAFDFIAGYSPRAVFKWEARMLETFRHLAIWPQTGMIRPEFGPPNIRFWVVDEYLVLYNSASNPVEIIAILHGARDLSELIAARLLEEDLEGDDDND